MILTGSGYLLSGSESFNISTKVRNMIRDLLSTLASLPNSLSQICKVDELRLLVTLAVKRFGISY